MTWKLVATLGPNTYTAVQIDPDADPDPDPDLPLLLSASWFDQLDPEDVAWPRVQAVSTGALSILMADATDAEFIGPDTTVALEFYRQSTDPAPVATFYGMASDPTIRPDELGVLVEVQLADHKAELGDAVLGDDLYPQGRSGQRLWDYFTDAGITPPPMSYTGVAALRWPYVAARDPGASTLLKLADELLSWVVYRTTVPVTGDRPDLVVRTMREVRPDIDPATKLPDPATPWQLVDLSRELVTPAPGYLVLEAGSYVLDVPAGDAATAAGVIDAGVTSFDAVWLRNKATECNWVIVFRADESRAQAANGEVPARVMVRETQLVEDPGYGDGLNEAGEQLALYLLPTRRDVLPSRWTAERFTVWLDEAEDTWWPGGLRDVRAVTGIEPRHNPDGTSWWLGVITAREVRMAGGRCDIDLTMEPQSLTYGPDSITINELPGTINQLGVSINELANARA